MLITTMTYTDREGKYRATVECGALRLRKLGPFSTRDEAARYAERSIELLAARGVEGAFVLRDGQLMREGAR